MVYILLILLLPAAYLLCTIILILKDSVWVETDCEIMSFEIVKKIYGSFVRYVDDAPNNYPSVKYRYMAEGGERVSTRISLCLVERGYRPVEIEHDPFIKSLRHQHRKCYYLRYWPSLSVLAKNRSDVAMNSAILFIYLFIILSSSLIIIWIS